MHISTWYSTVHRFCNSTSQLLTLLPVRREPTVVEQPIQQQNNAQFFQLYFLFFWTIQLNKFKITPQNTNKNQPMQLKKTEKLGLHCYSDQYEDDEESSVGSCSSSSSTTTASEDSADDSQILHVLKVVAKQNSLRDLRVKHDDPSALWCRSKSDSAIITNRMPSTRLRGSLKKQLSERSFQLSEPDDSYEKWVASRSTIPSRLPIEVSIPKQEPIVIRKSKTTREKKSIGAVRFSEEAVRESYVQKERQSRSLQTDPSRKMAKYLQSWSKTSEILTACEQVNNKAISLLGSISSSSGSDKKIPYTFVDSEDSTT